MTNSNIAIEIKSISKAYRLYNHPSDRLKEALHPFKKKYHHEFYALNDISFLVKKGETVGILGRNGAGKSTLLKIITGVLTPSSGEIKINGKISSLLELGAGFNPEYTGIENIYFQGSLMGFTQEQMEQKVQAIIDFADIGEFIYQPVRMYSSGMFARLAFAVSISVEPDILIVDEALSVGDDGFQMKCAIRMNEMKKNGVTILLVSHSTQAIVSLCNRGVIIDSGRLIQSSTNIIELTNNYQKLIRNLLPSKNNNNLLNQDNKIESNDKNWFQNTTYPQELGSIQENRFGNFEAKILNVLFFDQNEKETTLFEAGSHIKMKVFLESYSKLSNLVLGYSLRNNKGIDICGDNSYNTGQDLNLEKGVLNIEFEFSLNIQAGEYFFYIGLATLDEQRKEIDQRWPMRKISVFSNRNIVGLAFCPSNMKILA